MTAKFYHIQLKVRPEPHHPRYWDLQVGLLMVYLWADSPDQAAEMAQMALPALGLSIAGPRLSVQLVEQSPETPEQIGIYECCLRNSFGWYLAALPTGADEDGLEIG